MVFFEDDPLDKEHGQENAKPAWGPALIASAVTLIIVIAIAIMFALG